MHLEALILWFLLQLKVILCTFFEKKKLQLKKNELISSFFSNTKNQKNVTSKNKKPNFLKMQPWVGGFS